MDGYVAIAGSPVMGYYDGSSLPMWQYAQEYVLADRFFQAGVRRNRDESFLAVCGGVPRWPNAPADSSRNSLPTAR